MPKAVYCSSWRDKHNRPRCDSNLDPFTLQSDALTTRPLRLAMIRFQHNKTESNYNYYWTWLTGPRWMKEWHTRAVGALARARCSSLLARSYSLFSDSSFTAANQMSSLFGFAWNANARILRAFTTSSCTTSSREYFITTRVKNFSLPRFSTNISPMAENYKLKFYRSVPHKSTKFYPITRVKKTKFYPITSNSDRVICHNKHNHLVNLYILLVNATRMLSTKTDMVMQNVSE